MNDGVLVASGHDWTESAKTKLDDKPDEEDKFDAMGNKIEKKEKRKVLDKRKARKERMARKKAGLESEDELDDL